MWHVESDSPSYHLLSPQILSMTFAQPCPAVLLLTHSLTFCLSVCLSMPRYKGDFLGICGERAHAREIERECVCERDRGLQRLLGVGE